MALLLLAANNAQSVLAAGISSSATTMTLNTGTGALFPAPVSGTSFFKLTLIDAATGQISEIVHVTARTGDTLTIVRAQEGTLARAWSVNDIAANMMTAGTLNYILANFQPLDATLTAIAGLATGANKLPYFTGTDTAAQTDLTSVGRDIIGKNTIADILTYLGIPNLLNAKADLGGNANQDFQMANSGTGNRGVNNDRLNYVLQSYAAVAGNQYTPFSVGGATNAAHAVRLDQFQSGVNGNGAWTKLPGGGQWCRQNLTLAANGTTTWTFPAGFSAAPAVFVTAINGAFQCWLNGIGANNCGIYNNGAALNVNLLAVW